jgi:hypothetical protein
VPANGKLSSFLSIVILAVPRDDTPRFRFDTTSFKNAALGPGRIHTTELARTAPGCARAVQFVETCRAHMRALKRLGERPRDIGRRADVVDAQAATLRASA